jgi:peptidoglycan/xylan/chitin deacetylase (PgdA/CDA1 family)
VSPARFERQLDTLLRWYRPVAATDLFTAGHRGLHVTFDDAFRSVVTAVPTLRRRAVPATVFACSGYADEGRPLDVTELVDEVAANSENLATLRWDELRALTEEGIEIGSHTVSHPHLTRLDDAELHRELSESRERIGDELGRECRFLAYPFGDEDPRVRAAARRAGYHAAFSLPGATSPVDRFGIPRLGIWRRDLLLRTLAKVAFARPRARAGRDG